MFIRDKNVVGFTGMQQRDKSQLSDGYRHQWPSVGDVDCLNFASLNSLTGEISCQSVGLTLTWGSVESSPCRLNRDGLERQRSPSRYWPSSSLASLDRAAERRSTTLMSWSPRELPHHQHPQQQQMKATHWWTLWCLTGSVSASTGEKVRYQELILSFIVR